MRRPLCGSSETFNHWGTAMNKHQVRGAANEVAGNIQKNVGKATANGTQQVKGAAREVAGKVEKEIGNAKDDHDRKVDRKMDRDIERHTR